MSEFRLKITSSQSSKVAFRCTRINVDHKTRTYDLAQVPTKLDQDCEEIKSIFDYKTFHSNAEKLDKCSNYGEALLTFLVGSELNDFVSATRRSLNELHSSVDINICLQARATELYNKLAWRSIYAFFHANLGSLGMHIPITLILESHLKNSHIDLKNFLSKKFTVDELKTLAYDLHINHEDIAHENTPVSFARELMQELQRHGKIQSLVDHFEYESVDNRFGKFFKSEKVYIPNPFATQPESQIQSDENIKFIRIPSGDFHYGFNKETKSLSTFWISETPITNEMYLKFIESQNWRVSTWLPSHWNQEKKRPHEDQMQHPVYGISWINAMQYCEWLGRKYNVKISLPTEYEWEKAAGWDDQARTQRRYPWGDDSDDLEDLCNYNQSGETTPVNKYDPDRSSSFYGLLDLAGNVQEWTRSPYDRDQTHQERSAARILPSQVFATRGGSYWDDEKKLCTYSREGISANFQNTVEQLEYLGFFEEDERDIPIGFRIAYYPES